MLAESVGLALLVVLETLTPTERLAFVLHDMFAVPFAEIGEITGRSTDATKMLASRAAGRCRAHRCRTRSRGGSAQWSTRFLPRRGTGTSKGSYGCSIRR